MALPNSGQLSLTDIQAEFGADSSTTFSEFYRGAVYVPATRERVSSGTRTQTLGPNRSFGEGGTVEAGYSWFWADEYDDSDNLLSSYVSYIITNGATNATVSVSSSPETQGNQTFSREGTSVRITQENGYYTEFFYLKIIRQESYSRIVTENINRSVPSSGRLAFSNFYGATST